MSTSTRAVLTLLLCVLLGPALRANDIVPAAGEWSFQVGESGTAKVGGFGGCKFGVEVESSDSKVVAVTFKEGTAKSQKVTLRAVAPGTATVTISTIDGTVGGCEGFDFVYDVTVSADPKAFVKAAKSAFKEQLKATSTTLDGLVDSACDEIDGLIASVKAGDLPVDEALEGLEFAYANVEGLLNLASAFGIDTGYVDLWNLPEAQGLTGAEDGLFGYLPGGCGPYDAFLEAQEALQDKFTKTLEKKLKKAIKDLEKLAQQQLEASVLAIFQGFLGIQPPQIPAPLPAPAAQVQPDAPVKPLTRTSLSSARLSTSATTRLTIGGTADPDEGDVTVTLAGPDGASAMVTLTPDDDCVFRADFSSLAPGNYKVTMTQGDQTVEFNAIAA